jgi:hypothetical protein
MLTDDERFKILLHSLKERMEISVSILKSKEPDDESERILNKGKVLGLIEASDLVQDALDALKINGWNIYISQCSNESNSPRKRP